MILMKHWCWMLQGSTVSKYQQGSVTSWNQSNLILALSKELSLVISSWDSELWRRLFPILECTWELFLLINYKYISFLFSPLIVTMGVVFISSEGSRFNPPPNTCDVCIYMQTIHCNWTMISWNNVVLTYAHFCDH